MSVIIYHNPRCSKSRETLALLESHHIQPQVELYLQQRYSVEKLQEIADKLGITDIRQMMRTKDELYQSLPIVIHGNKAKIGRPPESVLTIL